MGAMTRRKARVVGVSATSKHQGIGRPTTYDAAVMLGPFCDYVAEGHTLTRACAEFGIGVRQLDRWEKSYPLFCQAVAAARELGADALVEKARKALEDATAEVAAAYGIGNNASAITSHANNLAHQYKWEAMKLRPTGARGYGDKIEVDATHRLGDEERASLRDAIVAAAIGAAAKDDSPDT